MTEQVKQLIEAARALADYAFHLPGGHQDLTDDVYRAISEVEKLEPLP